jgi:hypothetical protein
VANRGEIRKYYQLSAHLELQLTFWQLFVYVELTVSGLRGTQDTED